MLEKTGNSKLLVCTVFVSQFLAYSYSWSIMELYAGKTTMSWKWRQMYL